MADPLYTRAAATAARLLAKYGGPLTLRQYSAGTYDRSTSSSTPATNDVPRKGALLDFGAGQTEERGNLIRMSDKRLLLEPGTVPTTRDHVIAGTDEYSIVSIGEVNPAGVVVLYDIHLHK